ncbi:MAG TPA: hypothetical protein VG206_11580 [Terriglobia bacterium]|nr:hypothetical protein [Terriglobia bacterium]
MLRAGAGIFYDLGNMNMWQYVDDNPVFSPTGIFNAAFGAPPPLTNGAPTTIEEAFAGAGIPPLSQQYASLYPVTNFQPPRVLEWSFGAQSQLSRDMALEVDYVGNQAHHLDIYHAFGNQPEPGTGALQPRRPYPDFNILAIFTSDGDSNYNALQVKFTRRFSGGLAFLTSYTWSKARDDSEGIENQAGSQYAQDDNNIRANWAIAAGNIPQRFVFSPIWEVPVGKGKRFLDQSGMASRILGGWEFSGILTLQSGFPFTVLAPQDFSNTGSTSPRPDRTCGGNGPQTVAEWFNVNCFTTTFLGAALAAGQPRFGNSGRNILVGPPLRNLDLALIRNFALSERFKLEFRAEVFNLSNTPPFGLPNSTVGTTGFGALTSAGEARDLQFALKLAF